MESRFRFLRRSFCFLGGVLEYRKGICEVRIWFLRRGYWLVLLLFCGNVMRLILGVRKKMKIGINCCWSYWLLLGGRVIVGVILGTGVVSRFLRVSFFFLCSCVGFFCSFFMEEFDGFSQSGREIVCCFLVFVLESLVGKVGLEFRDGSLVFGIQVWVLVL